MSLKLTLILVLIQKSLSYSGGSSGGYPGGSGGGGPQFYPPSDWGWVYPNPEPTRYLPPTSPTTFPPRNCDACACNCNCSSPISNPALNPTVAPPVTSTCPPCPPVPTIPGGGGNVTGNGSSCIERVQAALNANLPPNLIIGAIANELFSNLVEILTGVLAGGNSLEDPVLPLVAILCYILGLVLTLLKSLGLLGVLGQNGLVRTIING